MGRRLDCHEIVTLLTRVLSSRLVRLLRKKGVAMTVVDDRALLAGWTAFGDELVRRILLASAQLVRAESSGDELQVQISSGQLEDLYALADRHDIPRACLP